MSAQENLPNCFAAGPPPRLNFISRNGVGRPNPATPTLFRKWRKRRRSFRPTIRSTSCLRSSRLMTDASSGIPRSRTITLWMRYQSDDTGQPTSPKRLKPELASVVDTAAPNHKCPSRRPILAYVILCCFPGGQMVLRAST